MRAVYGTMLMLVSLAGALIGAFEFLLASFASYFFLRGPGVGVNFLSVTLVLEDYHLWIGVFLMVACSVGFNRSRDFLKLATVREPFVDDNR